MVPEWLARTSGSATSHSAQRTRSSSSVSRVGSFGGLGSNGKSDRKLFDSFA